MSFGFTCPDLNGQNQNISAFGTPAFVVELGTGSRVWFQGVAPGVAPYASSTITRAAMVAGLAGAGADFTPIDFLDLNGTTITINGDGEIASITALAPPLLPPALPAACRIVYSSGVYCDVQGTVAAVSAAISAGGGGAAAVVGPLSTVYLEPPSPNGRGNDATGQRGNAARPFATMDAAIAAMLNGDTLEIASGTYAAPSAQIPALLVDAVWRSSSGATSVVIDAQGTGAPAIDLGGATRQLWRLEGIRIAQDPGQLAISADGSAATPGTYFANGSLALSNVVVMGGDVLARYVGTLVGAFTVAVSGGTWTLDTCGTVFFTSAQFVGGETMAIAVDNDDPLSPTGGASQIPPVRFDSACVFPSGTITCSGQGGLYAAPGSVLPQITGSVLTQSIAGPGWFSQVTILGACELVNFAAGGAFPDVQGTIDLTGAIIDGVSAIAQTPGAVNTLRVAAGGTVFGDVITIGEGCLADMRTASFAPGILAGLVTAGTNGRVIPPTFATFPELVQVPPLVSSFSLPFRLDSTDYAVALDYDAPGDAPGHVPIRTTTSFDVLSSTPAPSAGTVRAIVTYYGA